MNQALKDRTPDPQTDERSKAVEITVLPGFRRQRRENWHLEQKHYTAKKQASPRELDTGIRY